MSEVERALRAAGIDMSKGAAFGASTVYSLPGERALEAWRSLRAAVPITRRWPLLLGGGDSLKCHRDLLPDHSPDDVIAKAQDVDVAAFIKTRLEESRNLEDGELPRGDWPAEGAPSNEIGVHLEVLSRKPLRETYLALTPVPDPWEAMAYVPFGGWNACPFPEEHVAVLRHWSRAHGAEPVGVTKDTVECQATRPPTTREAALALAHEQYAYASDIVDQGIGTIDALAAALLNGSAWFFWWD